MIRAPVALTCGEPAGIGPELAEAAWTALKDDMTFLWIGNPRHLPGTVPHVIVQSPEQAGAAMAQGLPVLALADDGPRIPGQPQSRQARTVVAAIATAVGLCKAGATSAMCTLPIHKQALQDGAGFAYPGHTEYLAAEAGVDEVVMMLACDALRVVPVTIHVALAEVPQVLTAALLERRLRITRDGVRDRFGIAAPRIAVAGLNPHAGEGGKMGQEEIHLIGPVLETLRREGFDIVGPLSADTMFHPAARARYDVAVCMYHDQALIPIKTLDFDQGVNVTLGLPFLRTSPDHGTAFDIAGQGLANPSSTIAALRMAWDKGT